jgi:hypothetical protein
MAAADIASAQAGAPELGGRTTAPLIDVVAVAVLTLLALLGFQASYGGWVFLLVGGLGLALGLILAWLGWAWRQPAALVLLLGLVIVIAAGAIALPATSIGRVLPSLSTAGGLVQGFTQGWKELVTTPAPVGSLGNLMAIPYLCGFFSGLLALSAALRRPSFRWSVAPPILVLVASVVTGSTEPVSILLQGVVFAVVAIVWASQRATRTRERLSVSTRGRSRSTLTAAAVVVGGALLGVLLAPLLPGSGSQPRFLLRSVVEPDVDVSRFASPLVSTRKYLSVSGLADTEIFEVSGLPPGQPIRLGVMDTWDGTTTGLAGSRQSSSSGLFQRVGETIRPSSSGETVRVTITVLKPEDGSAGYSDYWLPTVGETVGVTFTGPDAGRLERSFRYNPETDTGLVTTGVTAGDVVELDAVIPPAALDLSGAQPAAVEQPGLASLPKSLNDFKTANVGDASTPLVQAQSLIENLVKNGFYSPVGGKDERPPGHGTANIDDAFTDTRPIGDEEQYGAAALLLARSVKAPVRLVMGFRPQADAASTGSIKIKGVDLSVWLEADVQGVGWVTLAEQVTPPRGQVKTDQKDEQRQDRAEVQPPPPIGPDILQPPPVDDATADDTAPPPVSTGGFPVWLLRVLGAVLLPILIVSAIIGLLLGLKAARRRRRRNDPDTAAAVTGGWREILDQARDQGWSTPAQATRTEGAGFLESSGAPQGAVTSLAVRADRAAFCESRPTPEEVAAYWADVDSARKGMAAALPWWRRVLGHLNPRSLESSRKQVRDR